MMIISIRLEVIKINEIGFDGLKLQPCSPTFVDARNAIIAADQAITGGKRFCLIWEVLLQED
jgi:hypothetical protein